jgi:ElaB/YqjD/DUF883 family membrane-anchored ribosome-binding protein
MILHSAEIKAGKTTVEELLKQYGAIAEDQLEELKALVKEPATPEGE